MIIWVLQLKAEGWDQSLKDRFFNLTGQFLSAISKLPAVIRDKQRIPHSRVFISAEKRAQTKQAKEKSYEK